MDDNASWLAFKDQLQAHYQALEAYHRELGGDYEDSSASLMDVLQAALQASLEATKAECDRVREDCESMLRDMTRMRIAMGESSKATGPEDPFSSFDTRARIKAPLLDTQKVLRIEHSAARKAFEERAAKVVDLYNRLQAYLRIIPASVINLTIPVIDADHPPIDVSLARLGQLDAAIAQCKQEVSHRKKEVQTYGREIVQLWAELAIESDQIATVLDRQILLDAQTNPESLGMMDEDIEALLLKRDELAKEKARRKDIIDGLTNTIRSLHRKLRLPEVDLTNFLLKVRGVGHTAISMCESELARLTELKKDHIEDFIKDARQSLENLWDSLYYDEDDRLEFTPAFTDTFTDAALQAHENEIASLQHKIQELEPLLSLIIKHMELDQERKNLEAQVSDPARFSKRGYNPMAESKLRAKIENTMPRTEQALREAFANYAERYSVPFRVWGELYLDAEAPSRKPISRHEALTQPLKAPAIVTQAGQAATKSRPRTPGTNSRPVRSATTTTNKGHPLSRSLNTPLRADRSTLSRPTSRSPTKSSVPRTATMANAQLYNGVLRERANSNSSRLPTAGSSAHARGNTARTISAENTKSALGTGLTKSSQMLRAIQMAPPKPSRAGTLGTREVSGSSTSSQVSTENWDAYDQESSEDDENHDGEAIRHKNDKNTRMKQSEQLHKDPTNPTASMHPQNGAPESPLYHVVEEGSFGDDWGGEGF